MNLKYKGEQHEKMTNEEIEELLGDMAAGRPIKRPLKNIEKGTTCDELHSVFYSWFTLLKVTLPTIFPADYDRHDYQPKFKLYDYVESFDGFEWGPLDLEDKKFAGTSISRLWQLILPGILSLPTWTSRGSKKAPG